MIVEIDSEVCILRNFPGAALYILFLIPCAGLANPTAAPLEAGEPQCSLMTIMISAAASDGLPGNTNSAVLELRTDLEASAQLPPLYSPAGITPTGVRQGLLGSCYFHAVLAGLAQTNPELIKRIIQENADGSYTAQFADGKKENAYPEDIRLARERSYDLSDGLWVSVLLRAYAQKVLREALLVAIDRSSIFDLVKSYAREFVAANDMLLLAYDRAIRAVVTQEGKIDRETLKSNLKQQVISVPVPASITEALNSLLDSEDFFETIAETVRENGELFGAYRAIAHGGFERRVMEALTGSAQYFQIESEAQVAEALSMAINQKLAITAGTRSALPEGRSFSADIANWYENRHAYTMLGFDAATATVTIRNPWGFRPDPNGIISIPLSVFVAAFYDMTIRGQVVPPK